MQKEINLEKTCTNCRYYSQHYSKQNTRYDIVCCGHCINKNNKKMKPIPCEYWEDVAIKKEERKESIKDTIRFMSERLNDIAMILQDDEE